MRFNMEVLERDLTMKIEKEKEKEKEKAAAGGGNEKEAGRINDQQGNRWLDHYLE